MMTKTWPVDDDNQKAAISSKQNRNSGWNRRWMQDIPTYSHKTQRGFSSAKQGKPEPVYRDY